MPTLSVVIPAWNEESGIQEIMDRVLSIQEPLAAVGINELELIVVDDGSTDATPAIVADMAAVRLIRHPVNRGYGAALKTGFAAARGEWIGFLDADGTYPPEYFPRPCEVALERERISSSARAWPAPTARCRSPPHRKPDFCRLVNIIAASASRIRPAACGSSRSRSCQPVSVAGRAEPDAGHELRGPSTNSCDGRGADSLQRAHRSLQAERRPRRHALRPVHRLDGAELQPGATFGLIGMASFAVAAVIGVC